MADFEVMQRAIIHLLQKLQLIESRSSKIFVVVERRDHHCGDDLVIDPQKNSGMLAVWVNTPKHTI